MATSSSSDIAARSLGKDRYPDAEKKLRAAIVPMTDEGARGLAVELAISSGTFFFGEWSGEGLGRNLVKAASYFKVDLKAAAAEGRKALTEKKEKR